MTKKGRRVGVQLSPPLPPASSPWPGAEEETRARLKFQGLLQDYLELLKETEAKEKRLQKAKQKKHKLLAEVKFLRRKYKSLLKNPTQKSSCRLKKQVRMIPVPSAKTSSPQNLLVRTEEDPLKDKNHRVREDRAPRTSAVLDLNEAFYPNSEEMEEFQVEQEEDLSRMEKLKKGLMEGEPIANDLKLSICRDVGVNSSRLSKRKISWQDQVALRV